MDKRGGREGNSLREWKNSCHCLSLLDDIFLLDEVLDKWVWTHNHLDGYSMKDISSWCAACRIFTMFMRVREGETIIHLVLDCDFFKGIWHPFLKWLRISTVNHSNVDKHALQFGGSRGFRKDI